MATNYKTEESEPKSTRQAGRWLTSLSLFYKIASDTWRVLAPMTFFPG